MDVFGGAGCSRMEGHDIYVADATKTGGDDRVMYCGNCGQAVKLSVAIARTTTPTVMTGPTATCTCPISPSFVISDATVTPKTKSTCPLHGWPIAYTQEVAS